MNLDERDRTALFDALSDPASRAILQATSARALTAAELSDAIDLPVATLSPKLDRLVGVALLEKIDPPASDGNQPCQYRCPVEQIYVEFSETDAAISIDFS